MHNGAGFKQLKSGLLGSNGLVLCSHCQHTALFLSLIGIKGAAKPTYIEFIASKVLHLILQCTSLSIGDRGEVTRYNGRMIDEVQAVLCSLR